MSCLSAKSHYSIIKISYLLLDRLRHQMSNTMPKPCDSSINSKILAYPNLLKCIINLLYQK